jgi:hypothetical protein
MTDTVKNTQKQDRDDRRESVRKYVTEGLNDKDIAAKLHVSPATVRRDRQFNESAKTVKPTATNTKTTVNKKDPAPSITEKKTATWTAKGFVDTLINDAIVNDQGAMLHLDDTTGIAHYDEDDTTLSKRRSTLVVKEIHKRFNDNLLTVHNGPVDVTLKLDETNGIHIIVDNPAASLAEAVKKTSEARAIESTEASVPASGNETTHDQEPVNDDGKTEKEVFTEWIDSKTDYEPIGDPEEFAYVSGLSDDERWKYEMGKRQEIRFTTIAAASVTFLSIIALLAGVFLGS